MKINILLVDDRADKLLAIEAALASLQQNIMTARSGKDALRLLLHHEFAVILLDVNMPEMDGFETAELIRQRDSSKDVPIIFVSALEPSDERVRRAYSLRAVDYVPSPGAAEVLHAKVSVLVELHLKNQRLRDLANDLKANNAQLEKFCYAIAHDLRAPLRALQSFAQILLAEHADELKGEGKDYLNRINISAARMDTLTADLLCYSRVQRTIVQLETFDLEATVKDALAFLADEIHLIGPVISVPKELPQVTADKQVLTHVLINLIGNAIRFIEEGKRPEVRLFTVTQEKTLRVCVQDNGLGIEPEYHEKVFDIFERLNDNKNVEGSGVGLAIVKTGIEQLGGKVGVESELGKGSTFWFELPIR
jgi:two-component system sensor histidine kinase/response regulator